MQDLLHIVEAIVFAAGSPITRDEIIAKLPERVTRKELNAVIFELQERYGGKSGIVLDVFNESLQFASNAAYGEIVAEVLQPVKEKELTKILLEVLAIIAYRQPVTRGEIEEIRGTSAEYAISVLSRVNLIKTCGFKQAPGKPMLYGTTDEFLKKFELQSLDDMPDYGEVMRRLVEYGNFNLNSENLYREVRLSEDEPTASELQQEAEIEQMFGEAETPTFLKDETFETIEADDAEAAADAQEGDLSQAREETHADDAPQEIDDPYIGV